MAEYPKEVEAFHDAIRRLISVQEVDTGLKELAHYGPETYSLPNEFGDLPHALLRRTGGGLKDEVWINTEIALSRDEAGWLTLEFLAWWVRDLSRSNEQIQMRPMALPPKAFEVQLGTTLKFIIDQFQTNPGHDLAPILQMIQERSISLNDSINHYTDVLGNLVNPKLGRTIT